MKRLLVAGFGDIAGRALRHLEGRFSAARLSRAYGFDLDRPDTLMLPVADSVLHCAPPPPVGESDTRTAHLLDALEKGGILPARIVYVSTMDESRPVAPRSERARRRVDAEGRLAQWTAARGIDLVVLRAPGIYARDRLPLARLRAGTPVLRAQDDVYTNHIHADDLARIICRALEGDAPPGIYNASDDTEMKLADWLDRVADAHGMTRPPRISLDAAKEIIPEPLLSFMRESRRLDNGRLKRVLGVRLQYPTVQHGLSHEHLTRIDQPA